MVVDPQFPTCPIRNVLAKTCEPDTLWVIQSIGSWGSMTYDELLHYVADYKLCSSLANLIQDRIITKDSDMYHLTPIGQELFPHISTLVSWCYANLL